MRDRALIVVLFLLSRCKRTSSTTPGAGAFTPSPGWQPDPDGYNVPVVPLPPNPLAPGEG